MLLTSRYAKYFIDLVNRTAEMTTCLRRGVGAILVKDKRVIATGFNGAPSGVDHCETCIREEQNVPSGQRHELCMGLHAEQNCLLQCAYMGLSSKGATLICTNKPCSICTKMIINAGIKKVFYLEDYEDKLADRLLRGAGVYIEKLNKNDFV
jgi:dCMP deaminase